MIHRFVGAAVIGALLLAPSGAADAQKKKKPAEPPAAEEPKPAEPAAEPAPPPLPEAAPEPDYEEDEGPIEEPRIPVGEAVTVEDMEGGTKKVYVRPTKKTYPIELTQRPLTLPRYMAEVSLDSPFVTKTFTDNPGMWQVLRAAFGVTQDIEVGITYSFGLITMGTQPAGSPTSSFEVGKAFSFDGALSLWPQHIALRVSVPFYVDADQFGMGINAGIPMRLSFGGGWAVFGLHDMVQLKISGMPVDPTAPANNLTAVFARKGGSEIGTANLAIRLGAMYQIKPNIAAYATIGFVYPALEQIDQQVPLFVGATWSKDASLDVGGRIGLYDPAHAGDSFSVSVYAAYRL